MSNFAENNVNIRSLMNKVCAFAPATIANVNVGFDVLGLSLASLGDKVEVSINNLGYNRIVEIISETLLPLDPERNSCTYVIKKMQEYLKSDITVDVKIKKGFASGSGLGSSSASSAAATFAFNALLDSPFTREELLPFAAEGERIACGTAHYDNIAPALLGGIVLLYDNKPICLPLPESLYAISFFPSIEIKTSSSRSIVAQQAPLSVIAKQVSAMGAFVAGFYRGDYELIKRASKDYIVEPSRKILIPYFDEMREKTLAKGGIAFGISGSGPSVFALSATQEVAQEIRLILEDFYKESGIKTISFIENLKDGTGAKLCEY